MKKLNMFLMLVVLGFGMMIPQTAQAVEGAITQAPCEGNTMGVSNDGGNCGTGPLWNARIAIAPYAQVLAGNSYTFIGISHPSLATAHTSIGVVVEALNMTTVPNTRAGRAAVFTVHAGTTHRVFVVNQSHSTINLDNSAFTDSQTHLITTTDSLQAGNIKVWGIHTNPTTATLNDSTRPGDYARDDNHDGDGIYRFDNLSQLAMWGVVYQTANGAGFALEFVGDMHDSSALGMCGECNAYEAEGTQWYKGNNSGVGRGIN